MVRQQGPDSRSGVSDAIRGHDDVGNNHAIRGRKRRHPEGRGYGLVLFAAMLVAGNVNSGAEGTVSRTEDRCQ